MSPRALGYIIAAVALINFAFGVAFILEGAWPIFPFMGLDVLLLAWAFRAIQRAARRFEQVTLTSSALRIAHHPAKGAPREAQFNPYWVQVDLKPVTEFSNQLFLRSHGKSLQVGSFLGAEARTRFAENLKDALHAVRNARF